jgi:uncharacterized protein YxjI
MPPVQVGDIQTLDRIFVQQKFAPMVNLYRISTVGPDGKSAGTEICHVRQKRLKIREQIDFFADQDERVPVMRIKARKVFEFRGRFDVIVPDGTVIGQLQKQFAKSLLRSTWTVFDGAGREIAWCQEQSMALAFLRRVWGIVPYAGDFPLPVPFHFDIKMGEHTVGEYRRLIGWRDRYVLDLTGDPQRYLDRRTAIALTIALDALMDR